MKRLPVTPSKKPIYGENGDEHRYYRCKHCGFICDIKRDSLGPGEGVTHPTFTDADGLTKYKPYVTDGCRLCGSKNYK